MSFYEVEFNKKENGWVAKKQGTGYKYTRVPNSPSFPTIEEAEKWINENDKDGYPPWIDHKIGNSVGHLMALQEWKECCDDGGFIDYDGYGDPIDENYQKIDMGKVDDFFDEVISPSDYTHLDGAKIPENTVYILWYNR